MPVRSSLRRSVATLFVTAGLAYPACAAVCPKGIGGCPSPGRCFLFTDADANLFCDYTSRTASPASGTIPSPAGAPAPAQTAVPATAVPLPDPTPLPLTAVQSPASPVVSATTAPAPVPDTTAAVLHQVSSGGLSDAIHLSAPLAGLVLFLVTTGIIFFLLRNRLPRTAPAQSSPVLALSAFFGLGISLIMTFLIYNGTPGGTTYALVWMGAGTPLAGYLWQQGAMTRNVTTVSTLLSALAGFVFLAPIMPLELGGIINVITGVSALTPGIIVICAVILLALLTGRAFCGAVCPVGSLQELAYNVPIKKILIRQSRIPELLRFAVFIAAVIAAFYLIDLMAFTGLYDLFSLTISAGLFTAAGLILVSVFLYRPVCRILCPFGVLFSLPAWFSLFKLRRTADCITCRKCEKACPAGVATQEDSPKRECYLCARCTDACPVRGALAYRR